MEFRLAGRPASLCQHKVHSHRPLIDIRGKPDSLEAGPAHRLQPHALPDSRAGSVPDKLRFFFPVLFSPRDRLIRQRVPHFHPNLFLLPVQAGSDIPGERSLPSHMLSHKMPVHKDAAPIIHCSEINQNLFSPPRLRNCEGPLICHVILFNSSSYPA